MAISFHPEPESLMSCSAGSMPEAFAAVMASHITMCPQCRQDLAVMQDIGVALLDALEPTALIADDAPLMWLRAREADQGDAKDLPSVTQSAAGDVPAPLVPVLGSMLDHVAFKTIAPGVATFRIRLSTTGRGTLLIAKVGPGRVMPSHGHNGSELAMVLRGAFHDGGRRFGVGDVADLGTETEHAPVADATEGCICLIATEGKLRYKSRLARLLQPLTGM